VNALPRVFAIIPARGGSKSVPGKNIKSLGGRPLIAWSIEAARAVPEVDRIIVSTDSAEIRDVAIQHGAEVYNRTAELAGDTSLVIDALRDLYRRLSAEGDAPDIMILLEPTCPFRSPEDVRASIRLVMDGCDSAASFKEAELNPHRAWRITGSQPSVFIDGAVPWRPRQELPSAYQLNGGVYAFRPDRLPPQTPSLLFGRTGASVMPPERSIDIDTHIDFMIAEAMLDNPTR
jgi:CMP-N,N'-diacetyllegionaminic acid synthase